MSTNERPGVYTSVEVSSVLGGAKKGRAVGIAGAAASGTKGKCVYISSYGAAVSEFGDCSLTKLIRILLQNGGGVIYAVAAAVNDTPAKADYEAAFSELMKEESITLMLCDSQAAEVHSAMAAAIAGAAEKSRYRIGVVEGGGTVAEITAAAEALNCERMVMVYPALSGEGQPSAALAPYGAVAAAFGGALAAGGDPALPMSGAELAGLDGFAQSFSDADVTTLVQGGVTPVESIGGRVSVIRAVTTRTKTGGESDSTWRELTTVLIVDDVVPAVRAALRTKFPRVKNNARTRGAIRTQVLIELESKLRAEIIDSYGAVTATANETDPGICEVSFEFTVCHGLNRINLAAHITV